MKIENRWGTAKETALKLGKDGGLLNIMIFQGTIYLHLLLMYGVPDFHLESHYSPQLDVLISVRVLCSLNMVSYLIFSVLMSLVELYGCCHADCSKGKCISRGFLYK